MGRNRYNLKSGKKKLHTQKMEPLIRSMIQKIGDTCTCHCSQLPVAKASSSLIKGDFFQKKWPGCSIPETTKGPHFLPAIVQLAEHFIQEYNLAGMVNGMFC